MRAALKTSSNRAAVRMLEMIGAPAAVSYAGEAGPARACRAVPSLALGSGEVTLFDMTSAYGAFAAEGLWHKPSLIRRVEDLDGTVLFTAEDAAAQAVQPDTAFLMTSMLQDVIDGGTAWKARQLGFQLPAAGKTGTTNEYRDAWFVGYTKSLVSGVWVGYDTPKPILPGAAYAADVAVPLWARFMTPATANDKPEYVQGAARRGRACRSAGSSGKRPAGGCDAVPVTLDDGAHTEQSMMRTEYFAAGTEPEDSCHAARRPLAARPLRRLVRRARRADRARGAGTAEPPTNPAAAAPAPPAQQAPAGGRGARGAEEARLLGRLFGRGSRRQEAREERPAAPAAAVSPRMPFRDIVGHRHLTSLLARAVARGTVPPTLLLAGPAGVGKWRVARALAEALNCLAPVDGDACGTCRSCDRISRDVHVDVTARSARRHRQDQDRARCATCSTSCGYRPFEGQRRVVLIRDADALLESAQNALLKSLEEPPPATVFVLTSAAPDSLLRTVRSRTMRLTFGRLPVGRHRAAARARPRDGRGRGAPLGDAGRRQPRRRAGPGLERAHRHARRRGAAAARRRRRRPGRPARHRQGGGRREEARTHAAGDAGAAAPGVVARARRLGAARRRRPAAARQRRHRRHARPSGPRPAAAPPPARRSRPSTAASAPLERNAGPKLVTEWICAEI